MTLIAIGAADLSAGRLYEGHVNAVKLVFLYGGEAQQAALAADVRGGAVCGVWNAEGPAGLRLDRLPGPGERARLAGAKTYCSGIGLVTRPLVPALTPDGEVLMLALRLDQTPPHDLSGWTMRGMRATATGTVDFTGIEVNAAEVIGAPGDYLRSPAFKGGAWRFAAVQAGAVLRLATLMREALRARGRPRRRDRRPLDPPRRAVRRGPGVRFRRRGRLRQPGAAGGGKAALEVVALAERGLGLAAFARPDPVERVVRDLTTYLRQPAPDGALDDAARYLHARAGEPAWSSLDPSAP